MQQTTLTAPLSSAETEHFRSLFERRLDKVKAKTAAVFAFQDLDPPPFIVNSALYWVAGLEPETFPDEYFHDPAVMTNFQERTYYEQVQAIDDDFVPYLMPWFGTVVAASAFGCQIQFQPKQDPAVNPRWYPVQTTQDVRKLRIPDPDKDGLMPTVLEFQRYMKGHSFLPVGITDFQGPLTTANQLMGYDKLIYLMEDEPTAAHELLDKVTEALICWAKKQKQVIGEPLHECISDQQVYIGKHAGIWFSDDDAVLMSAKSYAQFVVPCIRGFWIPSAADACTIVAMPLTRPVTSSTPAACWPSTITTCITRGHSGNSSPGWRAVSWYSPVTTRRSTTRAISAKCWMASHCGA